MSNYALIKDGLVENVVVWDGEDDIFSEYTTYELSDGEVAAPGFSATKNSNGNWTFIAPEVKLTPQQKSELNIISAQSEYDRASSKINSIRDQIEDEDFATISEDELNKLLATWTNYRKSLRSYLALGDGSKDVPLPPED